MVNARNRREDLRFVGEMYEGWGRVKYRNLPSESYGRQANVSRVELFAHKGGRRVKRWREVIGKWCVKRE